MPPAKTTKQDTQQLSATEELARKLTTTDTGAAAKHLRADDAALQSYMQEHNIAGCAAAPEAEAETEPAIDTVRPLPGENFPALVERVKRERNLDVRAAFSLCSHSPECRELRLQYETGQF